MTEDTKFLVRVVKKASKLIHGKMNIKDKSGNGDLVTNFDVEIEKFIVGKIKKKYPDFDIISEEFNSKSKLTKNCFTIDPIDGTVNFVNNIPLWGIQVACVRDGKTCSAVIYLPEFKELYTADKDGAFLNGTPLHVKQKALKDSIMLFPTWRELEKYQTVFEKVPHFRELWAGSVHFARTAAGRFDGFIFGKAKYWDYVPGMYLVKQAGNYVYDTENLHIVASSKELFDLLKKEGKRS